MTAGETALLYAKNCWPVFPCRPRDKRPLTEHGFKEATTDPAVIREWWQRWPDANVGVPTGGVSGLLVIDLDKRPEADGEATLAALEAQHGTLPETAKQRTGGGGSQLIFRYSDGIKNSAGKLGAGIDVRGEGGYIVAPPSIHPNGQAYRWESKPSQGIAEAPAWLLDQLRAPEPRPAASKTTTFSEGGRNDGLFRLASSLRAKGLTEDAIRAALLVENAAKCNPPLPEREVETIARQAGQFSPGSSMGGREPPQPLRRELPPAEPFPLDALPPVLRNLAEKIGNVTQSPSALQGQSLLAACALTAQTFVNVEIDGRRSPSSEFFLAVASTGERKSAVDEIALAPHRKREADLRRDHSQQLEEYTVKIGAWKKARDEAAGPKVQGYNAKQRELGALGPEPLPPLNTQILTDEPTYEGLVKGLHLGQPSMGLFSDEGGRFLGGHAMNSDNALKTVAGLSQLWDGKPITRTRAGDGAITLPGRRASLHLMIQPVVASSVFSNEVFAGQGFLSRCLVTFPMSTIGGRRYQEENLRESAEFKAYFATMMMLLERRAPLADGERNELAPIPLVVEGPAKRVWIGFHDHVEQLQREGRELFPIRGFASKVAEHAARLAASLAFLHDPEARSLSGAEPMEQGIELAQFYLGEALRLFHSATEDPGLLLAERALLWAREQGNVLSLVDLYQRGPNALRNKAAALSVVGILEDHGWLVRIPGGAVIGGVQRRDVWQVVQ